MLKAIVIDDELHSRELMSTLLQDYCQGVEVCGSAGHVRAGIDLLLEVKPDVVFLDLEMPGGDGLAFLEAFQEPWFRFVFVTGYPAGKLKELEAASLAWLRKPVDLLELQGVLEKLGQQQPLKREQLEVLWRETFAEAPRITLELHDSGKTEELAVAEIACVVGKRSHTLFHLVNGRVRVALLRLQHYEQLLPKELFFRSHRSCLVNLEQVQAVEGSRSAVLHLKNGQQCPLAARRKAECLRLLKSRSTSPRG